MQKIQSTCSKKFKKILDENKFLKSKLSEIKTLLLGKLKADGDILSDKQPDNFQGEPSHDSMVDDQSDDPRRPTENKRSLLEPLVPLILYEDQDPGASLMFVRQGHTDRVVIHSDASLSLPFHGHDKLFFDIHTSAFEEKKRRAKEGKNEEGHSNKKEEAAKERVIDLGPLNMEDMRQEKNQGFGGIEVDGDNIDETKNCGDVDSIINNVISSVFVASSSLPTSPDIKKTQAERSISVSNSNLHASLLKLIHYNVVCGASVCAFTEYAMHGRDIPKEIDIGYVRMRTFVSGGFVIRSFMLSGTIHDVVLPTGRISPWYEMPETGELSEQNIKDHYYGLFIAYSFISCSCYCVTYGMVIQGMSFQS
ncbi:hypothetical protein BC332_25483 [Capsicum chinense]|nr:hypothetical protein BC332_25483 [Capsicum chinense]